MGKKPAKIKRYRRSFTGAGSHSSTIRRVAFWVAVAGVLFVVGWLIAKPGLDLASGIWYSHKNGGQPAFSAVQSEPAASEAQPTSEPQSEPQAPQKTGQESWTVVSLTAVSTPEQAAQTAAKLTQQGITAAVIPLKDETGTVYYDSQVALAKAAISGSAIDAKAVAEAFTQAGVTPVAGIWAFKDAAAPYADRTLAVKYQGTDYNWLDNSQDLGGKPWLNPNAQAAQDYIADLIGEVTGLGYSKTVLYGLQFPEGYSLDACDYGALAGTKADLLSRLGQRYQSIEGAQVWFCFDQAALAGTATAPYGDVSPATFGLQNLLVKAQLAPPEDASQSAGSGSTAVTAPTDLLASLAQTLTDAGVVNLGYYLPGATAAELEAAVAAGFAVTAGQS